MSATKRSAQGSWARALGTILGEGCRRDQTDREAKRLAVRILDFKIAHLSTLCPVITRLELPYRSTDGASRVLEQEQEIREHRALVLPRMDDFVWFRDLCVPSCASNRCNPDRDPQGVEMTHHKRRPASPAPRLEPTADTGWRWAPVHGVSSARNRGLSPKRASLTWVRRWNAKGVAMKLTPHTMLPLAERQEHDGWPRSQDYDRDDLV